MKKIENPKQFEICKFDGVNSSAVYIGGMDSLERADGKLKWRIDKAASELCFDPYECLTLAEIKEQLKKFPLITVITIAPLSGSIYQCGNYRDDEWWEIGDLSGYA